MSRNPLRGDSLGVHFAVKIFLATTSLWILLRHLAGLNPIWAVSSMMAARSCSAASSGWPCPGSCPGSGHRWSRQSQAKALVTYLH